MAWPVCKQVMQTNYQLQTYIQPDYKQNDDVCKAMPFYYFSYGYCSLKALMSRLVVQPLSSWVYGLSQLSCYHWLLCQHQPACIWASINIKHSIVQYRQRVCNKYEDDVALSKHLCV